MAERATARYGFGLVFTRFMPLNDDLTIPIPERILGGAGPFDFSDVDSIAAVELITKIDNEAAETVTVDLSGVVDPTAVTVAELFAAINVAGPTDLTASEDATTGRIMMAYDLSDDVGYVQIYGECAEIAMFGQGFGVRFVKSDTLKSLNGIPNMKDEEIFETADAMGLDTTAISDGYRKGIAITFVDSAEDWDLLALMENGYHVESNEDGNEEYDTPTSEDSKIYFFCEVFYTQYTRGENKEGEIVNYVQKLYRTCKGNVGESSHERGFMDGNFTIIGTSYKDQDENLFGDTRRTKLSIEAYQALDVYNV
ncbi:hypothetical protein LCGC14_0502920 [marine sediment metagenome]|uniref:Uncharacterized protein n=1 Tax=marine sediment metagenome TaxID=412755 RepID=A0A0F9S8J1_9ZZZZ